LRLVAGVPEGVAVDLGLVRLPEGSLMFPNLIGGDLTTPRFTRQTSTIFTHKASKLGFEGLRFHDLDAVARQWCPVHVVAARCGHDPATLLRSYAKRTRKADTSAAGVIGSISKGILGS
jgi:integrase